MWHRFGIFVVVFIFLLSTLAITRHFLSPAQAKLQETNLPVLGSIPTFELIDQYSQPFSFDDLKGQVWLADFIFTTCPSVCPVMTQKMLKFYRRHQDNPNFRALSITVNPTYDSPKRLKTYAESYGIKNEKWFFLTGAEDIIHQLAWKGFKVGSKTELANHSPYFILLDDQQRIRGYYDSSDQHAMRKLEKEIVQLLTEVN